MDTSLIPNTNVPQINTNSNKTSELISYFNQDSSKIKCALCNYSIEKGEIIYHCNCEAFIHSTCYIKNQEEKDLKRCLKCNETFTLGIYDLYYNVNFPCYQQIPLGHKIPKEMTL